MNKILFLLSVLLVFSGISEGQNFERLYNFSNLGGPGIFTSDGGYLVAGARFVKLNASGDTLWTRDYNSYASRTLVEIKNGYIIGGSNSQGSFLIKIDKNGNQILSKTFSWAFAINNILLTSDSSLVMGLTATSTTPGTLLKTNLNGDTLWTACAVYKSSVYSVIETGSGGYAFTGDIDGGIFRTVSKDGKNEKSYPNPLKFSTQRIINTPDQGFLVIGSVLLNLYPKNDGNIILVKTTAVGDTFWTATKYMQPIYNCDIRGAALKKNLQGYVFSALVNNNWKFFDTDLQGNIQRTIDFPKSSGRSSHSFTTKGGRYLFCGTGSDTSSSQLLSMYVVTMDETITSTSEKEALSQPMMIAPNPFRDMLDISLNTPYGNLEFQLYSSSMQLVRTMIFQNTARIEMNLQDVNSGVYFCRVTSNGQKLHEAVVVKE